MRGIALFCIALVACSTSGMTTPGDAGPTKGDATTAGPHPCDPLAAGPTTLTLANVLGAGKHADGTIYVLDDGAPEYRAFVSTGTTLQRKKVLGTGTLPAYIIATVADDAGSFALKIERSGNTPTKMGIYRGNLDAKDFVIGAGGSDELQLIGKDALAGYTLRNISPNVVVEYDALTDEGERLFVVRPEVDWKYEDFRVFYGATSEMLERKLVSVTRSSTTTIRFDVDGATYEAFFPSSLSPNAGPPKLTKAGGASVGVTLVDADAGAPGAGLSFVCIR